MIVEKSYAQRGSLYNGLGGCEMQNEVFSPTRADLVCFDIPSGIDMGC